MVLRGEKVVLRPIRMSDAPRFVKWLSDPAVNRFLARKNLTLKEEKKWIRGLAKRKSTHKHFAIDTKEGIHIGSLTLGKINKRDKRAMLGIAIGARQYWDKGYGSDAIKTILRYGFDRLKLHRIELDVREYNRRAIVVYRRLGFKLEGRRRDNVFYKGRFYDDIHMGILRNEWLQKRTQ